MCTSIPKKNFTPFCLSVNIVFNHRCTYGVMAAVWVDGERSRIAAEMLAREAGAVLDVEAGALVVLQARRGTVQARSGVVANQLRLIGGTDDRSLGRVAKHVVISLPHGARLTLYQPQTTHDDHQSDLRQKIHCYCTLETTVVE